MALGQVQMFDPAPTRRVVSLCDRWAGVDPSTRRCAIAVFSPDGSREVCSVSFPSREGAERQAAIYEGVRGLWQEMCSGVGS